jgi:flagellar operon protein
VIEGIFLPNPVKGATVQPPLSGQSLTSKNSSGFAGVLENKLNDTKVKFSGHALERLKERGIELGEKELEKLEGAVSSVAAKGGNESLIMVGDAALVVSVKNRTVITAFDRNNMDGNVFTRIDSAAIF